ncbi:stealth family protein [Kitasatospora sp. NPDC094015]|uniref:stealth family protein n=1 Tax=Kitasatospora sp. NPDC094015 TaxID=3155205 RepID=UPI0033246F6B
MSVRHAVPPVLRRPLAALLGRWSGGRRAGPAVAVVPVAPPDPLWVREEQLRARLPGIVRYGERLAAQRGDLLPGGCRDENLAEVADVLGAAGIGHGIVPDGRARHRLAIAPGDRAAVLAALAGALRGQVVYAELLEHGRGLGTVLAEQLVAAVAAVEAAPEGPEPEPAEVPDRVKGVRVYRPGLVGTVLHGPEYGCDVEFWDSAAPSPGAIAAIDSTPYGWWVPSLEATATTRIAGRSYPVVEAFTGAFPDDVDFPVDAVITWVDDTDPHWRRRRAEACEQLAGGAALVDTGDQRYRNRDELRYLLRSIAAHTPWIRHVHLVTDDQVPHWLDTDRPGLTVVPHRELFAGTGAPPVFNSHAIETRLHRIPGLAEHFLYLNDDMLIGRPLAPQAFFLGNGLPRFFPGSRVIPPGDRLPGGADPAESVYVAAQINTRATLAAAVGRTYPGTLKHAPYPLRRSVLAKACERFAAELAATTRSPFRAATDLAPITLATHFAHATGRAVEGQLVDGYFVTDSAEDLARLPDLHRARWADVFCLADGGREDVPAADQQHAIAAFLREYFPVPSPFERRPA